MGSRFPVSVNMVYSVRLQLRRGRFIVFMSSQWFDEIYRKNALDMVRFAARLLGDEEIAKELVQEAFLILLYKKDELRLHPNLDGWLYSTLRNLVMNEMQSSKYRLEWPLSDTRAIADIEPYPFSLSEWLPQELTPGERNLLVWFYEEQLTYAEIAARLGVSVLACRTRMFRAKKKCKDILENNF
jgi:RNA polymerase sigma-70 factor (ECF subfamily)